MKTFSRLTMLSVFLGIVLILVGGIAEAQVEPFLEVTGSDGFTPDATVGTELTVVFKAGENDQGLPNKPLYITATPNITVTSHTVPGTYNTGSGGNLIVMGILDKANEHAEIRAEWTVDTGRVLDAAATIEPSDIGPLLIVVNSPHPESPLGIGDTFSQKITIENRGIVPSLPLSAWQMDVVYNPLILEVVHVTEGDFLSEGGTVSTHYTELLSSGRIRVNQSRPGLAPPPGTSTEAMPGTAQAPSPPGIVVKPGQGGTLLTIEFKLLAVAEEPLGIHNVRLQSSQDYDKLPDLDLDGDGIRDFSPDRISYSILISDVVVATKKSSAAEDVNQDGKVNVLDLIVVAGSIADSPHNPRADVNGDGAVNVLDLVQIYLSPLWAEEAKIVQVTNDNDPALTAPSVGRDMNPATIQSWIDLARIEDDGSVIFDRGIANLEALLASQIPSQTKLLLNYPNPFNPETWIPYQLAKASDVTVMIHAMNGSLIRTIELGHQAAGIYKSKSHAAYWDGRNELGEHVASGLYFYTLTAGKFSATGKMLVRK